MSMSNTGGFATTGGTYEAVKVAVRVRPIVPEGNQCADGVGVSPPSKTPSSTCQVNPRIRTSMIKYLERIRIHVQYMMH